MDKSWLPSKKLVLSFGTLAILLLGTVAISELFNKNDVYLGENNSVKVSELRGSFSEKDTDGDGLMDWEESLWKTNINNIDTDGDGTNDGDEILQKRNPVVAGPDDLLKEEILSEDNFFKYTDEENLTETDKLSRDLLVGYLSMKKNGSFEENKTQFIQSLSQDVTEISKEKSGKFYTSADIDVIESNKKSDLDAYKKKFIGIMMFSNDPSQDIFIFRDALQNDSNIEISKLDASISLYEYMMENLLSIKVPSSLLQPHLIIVNSFDDMIEGTKKMRNVMIDPVGGLSGINLRIASEEVFLAGLNKLNDILEK